MIEFQMSGKSYYITLLFERNKKRLERGNKSADGKRSGLGSGKEGRYTRAEI